MKVMGGADETSLSAIMPYRMEVPPKGALNMSGSLHLTIGCLLRDEQRGFRI